MDGQNPNELQDNSGSYIASILDQCTQKIISGIHQSVAELKKIDSLLSGSSLSQKYTRQELKQLIKEAFDKADKYNTSASGWLSAVQEMDYNGYHGEKAKGLAGTSLLAQSSGRIAEETANSWIFATDAAYGYNGEAARLNDALDGMNSIALQNSISLEELAAAITAASEAASRSGVKINELAAITGTSIASAEKSGNQAGKAVISLFNSLQDISSDKITSTLDKAGASMTILEDGILKLRTPVQILKDLAKTYNSLGSNDPFKQKIAKNIGGKENAGFLAAMLENWQSYENMLQDYTRGTGSAEAAVGEKNGSWAGSLNQLSNSWTKLVNMLADSSTITSGIQLLNKFVNAMGSITESALPVPAAIAAVYTALKKSGGLVCQYIAGNFSFPSLRRV